MWNGINTVISCFGEQTRSSWCDGFSPEGNIFSFFWRDVFSPEANIFIS